MSSLTRSQRFVSTASALFFATLIWPGSYFVTRTVFNKHPSLMIPFLGVLMIAGWGFVAPLVQRAIEKLCQTYNRRHG